MPSLRLLYSLLLILCLITPTLQTTAQDTAAQDLEKRLLALNTADWQTAFSTGLEVADADSEAGFTAIKGAWPKLSNVTARQQLLKAFYFTVPFPLHKRNHPHILAILHLGATDSDKQVQQFAFEYIKQISLQDFAQDAAGYARWYAANGALPADEIESQVRVTLIKDIARATGAERDALATRLERINILGAFNQEDPAIVAAIRASNILKVIRGWLMAPDLTDKTVQLAGRLFDALKPDRDYLERVLRPLLEREGLSANARSQVLQIVARYAFPWAVDSLLSGLEQSLASGARSSRIDLWQIAQALDSIGDPRAIPTMIAAIQFDDTYDTVYGIGYFGLSKMTGVRYSSRHDGAWWGKWWARNKTRFPASVQKQKIPDLRPPDDPADAASARTDKRVAWLKANATPIRSIDPNDEDYTDLLPLIARIGSARIVQLGEQSHGDGATFAAKCRLVRFLHEKMGFDVLAWESSLFDCTEMEKALHSDLPLQQAIDQGIFPIWGASRYVTPVFQYARETYATPHPLEMTGFDCQFSTRASPVRFQDALNAFLKKSPMTLIDEAQRKSIEALLNNLQEDYKPTPEKRAVYRGAVEALLAAVERNVPSLDKAIGARETAFMRQTLKSLSIYEACRANPGVGLAEDNNVRDRAMADNLAWLANERYSGKKIIVWAASMHIARNLPTVKSPALSYAKLVNMGQGVHDAFKSQVYTIGFTAYEGSAGNPFSGSQALPRAGNGSLEALLHFAGMPLAWVDFRSLPADHWLRKPVGARPLGYAPMEAAWPNVFDAMLFTDRMFAADGDGKLPAMYRTAAPKPTPLEKETGALLEDIRRIAWNWRLDFAQASDPAPAGYDPKRLEKEIEGEWLDMLGFDADRMSNVGIYRVLPGDGKGYSKEEEGGFLIREPLRATLAPANYATFLLTGGIAEAGGVDSETYAMVYVSGEMAGKIHLKSYATAILKGDLKGSLATGSYFTGLITGDLAGTFEASSSGVLYVKGRLTGGANLAVGTRKMGSFKLWIGGHTTRKDLERIQGPGGVWLADTDLPPGVHKIGSLTVTVETRKP